MNRAAIVLRGASYGTVTPVDVIQRNTGASRTWARTAADRLAQDGFLEKEFLPRAGPGRPTVGYRLTEAGQEFLESFVKAESTRFKAGESLAGPTWALAHYGLPLTGQKDAFVAEPKQFSALEEIQAPDYVLAEPTLDDRVLFPSPDRLVLWLIGTGDERNILLAPILARKHVKDWDAVWALAKEQQMTNRLAYLLHISRQSGKIPPDFKPDPRTETLVIFGEDSSHGHRFNVKGTVAESRIRDFEAMYGTR